MEQLGTKMDKKVKQNLVGESLSEASGWTRTPVLGRKKSPERIRAFPPLTKLSQECI